MRKIMKTLTLIILQLSFFSLSNAQLDITKRKVTLDTLKARVDSVYVNSYMLFNKNFEIVANNLNNTVLLNSKYSEATSAFDITSQAKMNLHSNDYMSIHSSDIIDLMNNTTGIGLNNNEVRIYANGTDGKVRIDDPIVLGETAIFSGTPEEGLFLKEGDTLKIYLDGKWQKIIPNETQDITYDQINDSLKFEISRVFNDTIRFDYKDNYYQPYTVSANTTIKQDLTNAKTNSTASFSFIGNGTATLTFPENWRNIGDIIFDNTENKINYGIIYKNGNRITYNIYDTLLADVSAPVLDSAWQVDSSKVYMLFSENLQQDSVNIMPTSAISLTGATVNNFTGSGSDTIIANLTTNAVATAVSYVQPTSGKIQDIAGNLTANWTDSTVYNNISPASGESSFTINLNQNIIKTGDDYEGNGGSGFVSYCLFNEFLSSSTDGYVIFDYNSTADGTVIIGFDINNTNKDYTSYDQAVYLAQSIGEVRAITNGSLGSILTTASIGSKFKLDRTSGTVTIQYASDGVNFSTIHTFGGSSTGNLYVNLNVSSTAVFCRNLLNNF